LAKYKGFSLLLEFGNAVANGLGENYTNLAATQLLLPQQISRYFNLGNSLNSQLGYVSTSGYGFDLRYGRAWAEFENSSQNIMPNQTALTFGFSKYFEGNNIKLQTSYTAFNNALTGKTGVSELMVQYAF
jgi:hypothetical protein